MKLRSLLVSLVTSLLLLSASAVADAGWQHNLSHRHVSGKTSLKVTGADGLKVQITIDGSPKEDTIPAIFTLPDRDAYVPVTVVASDGQTFSQKIEIKSHQQAELVLRYEAPVAAPAAAAAPGRRFMGHAFNATDRCKDADRWELKMDFLRRSDGSNVRSVVVKPASVENFEIESGAYDVRLFARRAGATTDYSFFKTVPFEITADEWIFAYGCRTRSDKPGHIEKPAK